MTMQPAGSQPNTLLNNRYRLLAIVANGGMATVFKAQDTLLNRIVAIKIPRERYAQSADFVRRFREEAQSAANLNHPNVVAVYDVGRDSAGPLERWYLVMEFVEGEDLKQTIRTADATGRPMRIDESVEIARQIAEGVGYAHRRGIVHCDLKPQNVLLTPEGRVKVTDFGIARAYTATIAEHSDVVWGTPHYYSPEQAQGRPPGPASDVYSIGVMLFEMLGGRLPFDGKTSAELANQHMSADPPALHQLNPNVTLQLEAIVARALAKDPVQRYRDGEQFARILSAYLHQGDELTMAGTGALAAATAATSRPREAGTANQTAVTQSMAGQTTNGSPRPAGQAPSAAVDPKRSDGGPDILLWLLGAIAISCVLGLVGLYAVVLSRLSAPPTLPELTPSPQTRPTSLVTGAPAPTGSAPTPAATPTLQSIAVPNDLIGRIFDDPLSNTLRSLGWIVAITESAGTAPERTIVGLLPPSGALLPLSSTLTVTLSTGGRFDVKASLPPIVLDSVRFAQETYAPGQPVSFQVKWLANGRPLKNYKVFVHVWGPNGTFIQPDDREPRNNGLPAPTGGWQAGTQVTDGYEFGLPAGAPRGQYRVEVGMYDPSNNNQRVKVADYGRTPVNALHPDAVIVRMIEVR